MGTIDLFTWVVIPAHAVVVDSGILALPELGGLAIYHGI